MIEAAKRLLLLCLVVAAPLHAADDRIPLAIRGKAIVYLLPDSDTLSVRIQKRDLNIYENPDVLVARLLGPDMAVVAEVTIPDDGNADKVGPKQVQSVTLTAAAVTPGIYRLQISPQNGDQVFGFKPNCKRYLIEGPMFLNDYTLKGDICFMAPRRAFTIKAEAVHKPGMQKVPLYDGAGKLVHAFDLAVVCKPVTFDVPAEGFDRGKPWRLEVARQDVRFNISRVRYWSPAADSFYDLGKTRQMLTPYAVGCYLLPGGKVSLSFVLKNCTSTAQKLALSAKAAEHVQCRIVSPPLPVALGKGESVEAKVAVAVSADAPMGLKATCTLVASYVDDPAARSGAAIKVRVGKSPVSKPLHMPIVLKPYQHENAQFGYCPRYPCNAVFFDLANRPYIRTRTGDKDVTTGIVTLAHGQWVEKSYIPALKAKFPSFVKTYRAAGWVGTKTVFDAAGDLYTVLEVYAKDEGLQNVLLYSRDRGDSYQVYTLPRTVVDIEQWTGHNTPPGPPAIIVYTHTANHPARFASFNDLSLLFPKKTANGLELGKPVLVSKKCLGSCQHSGGPAPCVTHDGRTHVVWGEIDDSGVPGVPTYVATYDHGAGRMGDKVLLGYAPPVNDVHNVPGITIDSEGYLHVVTGAHGQPFTYRRSLKPNDAYSGWTDAVDVLKTGFVDAKTGEQRGRQTYLSLVCDSRDTLHIAYRQWRQRVDQYHGGRIYAALSYQRKPKGKPWEDARPLVVPPLPSYSVYYHKLTLDRRDRLYLSYSYYSIDEAYRNAVPGLYDYRAVITSADGGDTWKLAETADFAACIAQ